ncbi:Plasma membrane low glucose sensor [Aspergillus nanangensis]|uniref:Plasma membrane low glucose sensor n=1 Tax=Aspergillus nanangensis TaxID=2582783 RepID=A0AAD4GV10_ASPNN|nr:Plasma membrane low glucose sensor [Aspergillus nanangensis]
MGFALNKPDNAAGSATPAIAIGLFVAFGGVLFGYDTGIISGILAMKYWRTLFSTGYINPQDNLPDVSSAQSSMIVSLLSAGTFFGALVAAPVADSLGRRYGMIVDSFVFTFGVILQTIATSIPLFVAGRFFAGFGVGLLSATVPLYQSETAPKWIRGTIVGAYQLAITIGLLLAAIVNNSTKNRMDTGSYRIPVAIQFAWAIILVAGMLMLPESPRYLIKRDRLEDAAKSLSRLRRLDINDAAIVEELAEIQANHEFELSQGRAGYREIFKGTIGKRLATGCVVQALQQLAGVNFIFYYGTTFFEKSGIQNSFTITLVTNIINVCSSFPGLYMVEKWGRRSLLLFGAVGMCVSQFIVAIVGTVATSTIANKVLIAFVCVYMFFFASSWGPVAWVVTGELFPLKARAKCLSITTATNWLLIWAIAYATPYMVNTGPGNAGLQSKGLSLEQVDELYSKVSLAWKSSGFVPSIHYADAGDVTAQMELKADEKRSDQEHVERVGAQAGV